LIVHLNTTHNIDDPRIYRRITRFFQIKKIDSVLIGRASSALKEKCCHAFPKLIENNRAMLIIYNLFFALKHRNKEVFFIHDIELLLWVPILRLMSKTVIYDVHENYRDLIPSRPWVPNILKLFLKICIIGYEKFFCFFCNFISCPTKHIRKNFADKKTFILPNYPLKKDYADFKKNKDGKSKINVTYIGSISNEKGIQNIIELAKSCLELNMISFHLAGKVSNIELNDFKASLPANTVYLGELNHEDILRLLSKSKYGLCMLPSKKAYQESMPLKLFEYINSETIVIASKFIGWKFVEQNNHGALFDQNNVLSIKLFLQKDNFILEKNKKYYFDDYAEQFIKHINYK
tara:strand:- start:1180 stop:2223 length:1044 start_codon:yes stop_codon:yes gene_type:complete